MNRSTLKVLLVKHEGLKLKPYTDTAGKLTIGVGRNLTDEGITEDEAKLLLDNDINAVWAECCNHLSSFGFTAMNDVRQHALMDLVFNIGIAGVLKFEKMLAAVAKQDWDWASSELLDSRAYKEEPNRIAELAKMLRDGV